MWRRPRVHLGGLDFNAYDYVQSFRQAGRGNLSLGPTAWTAVILLALIPAILVILKQNFTLKVLTNEKTDGFKQICQSSSCERPETAQRILFLLCANNNCLLIMLWCRRCMKKSGKLASHVLSSNNAINSLPKLQISLGIVALFEKIYYEVPIITVSLNIGEDVQYRCLNEVYYVKSMSQPDTVPLLKTIIDFK
jgi:hypothetical protein